jgi:Lrp/AsnC family leucine-responsive transcriptional regulator
MCEQIAPAFHLSDLATWQKERKLNHDRASIVEVYNQSSVWDRLDAMDMRMVPPKLRGRSRRFRGTHTRASTRRQCGSVMGWSVTMIVLVTLERDRGWIVDDLVRKLRAAEEVIDIWYVTGDHDLVLHVAAQNMPTYDAFTRRALHAEEHVRSFKTLVVMQHPERAAPLPPPTLIGR